MCRTEPHRERSTDTAVRLCSVKTAARQTWIGWQQSLVHFKAFNHFYCFQVEKYLPQDNEGEGNLICGVQTQHISRNKTHLTGAIFPCFSHFSKTHTSRQSSSPRGMLPSQPPEGNNLSPFKLCQPKKELQQLE